MHRWSSEIAFVNVNREMSLRAKRNDWAESLRSTCSPWGLLRLFPFPSEQQPWTILIRIDCQMRFFSFFIIIVFPSQPLLACHSSFRLKTTANSPHSNAQFSSLYSAIKYQRGREEAKEAEKWAWESERGNFDEWLIQFLGERRRKKLNWVFLLLMNIIRSLIVEVWGGDLGGWAWQYHMI